MRDRVPCEFFLLRYVPDVVKGEFVNIGVVLREADEPSGRSGTALRTAVRFTRDWGRVRCMDAGADIGLLELLEQEIAQRLEAGVSPRDPKAVLATLEDSLSNSIQITEPRASLGENLVTEMEQLMRMYVEPMAQPSIRGRTKESRTGRLGIQAAVRTEFERAGVWRMLNKRIVAEPYTRRGDPLRIDCGYRPDPQFGKALRMFHAVSLEGDLEMAKVLAFTAPQLREGVERVEGLPLELTAVVEPLRTLSDDVEDEAGERYRFGVETMERGAVRVVTVNDLARAAQTARHELGL